MKPLAEILSDPDGDLRNFTNRHRETGLVRQWLNTPAGSPLPMQMFYGVSGAGKTKLVARIRQIYQPEPLPTAFLDLDTGSGSNRFTHDYTAALFEIARQFRVVCPRFELAYFRMLELQNQSAHLQPGQKSDSLLKDLTESTAGEALGKMVEVAELAPLGLGALVKLARVGIDYFHAPERQKAYRDCRKSDEGQKLFAWFAAADAEKIARQLQHFLALDLAERLPRVPGKACRALIVFDTLEHLRRAGGAGRQQFTDREQWIFELWKALREDPAPGSGQSPAPFVQILLLGRDRLTHWEEYCAELVALRSLEQHLLGGFSEADAREFLGKHAITELPLQNAILQSSLDVETASAENGYHVLSLGLLADAVTSERRAGRSVDPRTLALPPGQLDQLAARFLQSLPSPTDERRIVRLARTPRFDHEALRRIAAPDPDQNAEECRRILAYTFVQDAARPGWFVLHPRVREALLALPKYSEPAESKAHHQDWAALWKSRSATSDDDFAGLSWFHDCHLDRESALKTWSKRVEKAREEVRMTDHYRLLNWWVPTGLENDGSIDLFAARVLSSLANEIGQASLGLLSQNSERAIRNLRRALGILTKEQSPQDWAATQNNLGTALRDQAGRSEGAEAQRLLGEAVAAYREALKVRTREQLPQAWAGTQNNLGTALNDQAGRSEGAAAERLLGEAVAAYREALKVRTREQLPQAWAGTQNNLGTALNDQAGRSEGAEKRPLLSESITAFRNALEVYTKEHFPRYHEIASRNLARSKAALQNLP